MHPELITIVGLSATGAMTGEATSVLEAIRVGRRLRLNGARRVVVQQAEREWGLDYFERIHPTQAREA